MKNILFYIFIPVVFVLVGWFANTAYNLPKSSKNPLATAKPTPLAKYSIEKLSKTYVNPTQIEIVKTLKTDAKFKSSEFKFVFDPTLSNGPTKNVSGLINIPAGKGPFPLIVMFRGYVDPKDYFIGNGTQHAAEYFAQNGFITVAPDFLGYGNSDKEAENIFESRFQTYTTAMETLKSVASIKEWDGKNLFIWGHSNGGQIALTTLEETGFSYPAVLWAPVSKPFPYSILYYTDDASDSGKFLRSKTAEFENNYDSDLYSLTKYLANIKAPIQLNQGTSDEAVPSAWSDLLEENLKKAGVDVIYIRYQGADHNMSPNWNEAVANALNFFEKHLK